MGLASALTTALTGLSAAEVQIDVAGNNLANSQTVGFKASEAVFVTQFLQTQSLGSAPSGTNGGTNPRQIGLGVRVGEISPDFTQGTIEVSSSPSDLAIQGEGFFVVQGNQSQDLYTRNGIFKTNSENRLVTTTGNLVLGYGIDEDYVIRATDSLVPLEIPLGQRFVAKATENVRLEGTLTPTGDIADTAQVIDSVVLGNGSFTRPPTGTTTAVVPPGVDSLTGNYSYVVTWYNSGTQVESRPSAAIGPVTVINGNVTLDNMPDAPNVGLEVYDSVRIYRNLNSDSASYFLTGTVPAPGGVVSGPFTDSNSDLTISGNTPLNLDGPTITTGTALVDVLKRDGLNYENAFQAGTLTFQARKGGRLLAEKEFTILDGTEPGNTTGPTTVAHLLEFIEEATGIQNTADDPANLIPNSVNNILNDTDALAPRADVTPDGRIRVVSNNGVDNAIDIGLSSFRITTPTNEVVSTNVAFSTAQEAVGESTVADFTAYDSLGVPLQVRVTAVLESVTGSATTYRWFADCADNLGDPGYDISVGTGLLRFDGEGNLIDPENVNAVVSINRSDFPSETPLEFELDFSNVSGLASESSTLAATRQDGSPPGQLTSYIIGEDGIIRGVFTSGVTRDLGQIRLARFANPAGLEQVGDTMFREGINSGRPITDAPNANGMGKVVGGAKELSNTDIGRSMIDLVLASTQYRANSRVITTAQQLLDELLNLRR
jgi:flagellar hook protein FlgE